ncbi:MAG: WecB/TagA/CpsF family glycosyltransferase [Candidatus Limnocylindrales bacterium]|nr:WecB/TagA/CpsF family glycosyltransferase [Candidatus Limnocylindrales bacterium]
MKSVSILGVRLAAQRYGEAVDRLLDAAGSGIRLRVHFCNVHTLTEAQDNESLRGVFESAGMLAMDGMPLVWVGRLRGARLAERVSGPDVMLSLCDRGRALHLRHYFLGGEPGVPEALGAALTERFPGLLVVGTESPPFRVMSPDEDAAMVHRVNASNPHILWIGLGAPKQEFWAADHEGQLTVPLLLPVGAAFNFHSGKVRRAPRWMQRVGLEWLFRLAAEPRRLWRRYMATNSRFLYLVAREEIARRR